MIKYSDIIREKMIEIRLSKNLSQLQLAKKCNLPHSSINNYEKFRTPSIDTLNRICLALNIDMITFLDECKREMIKQEKSKRKE